MNNKLLLAAGMVAAFTGGVARAHTISPFNDAINLGTGVWTYGAQHTSGELHDGDGFAIFDFAGFTGFGAIAANWTASTQLLGSPYGSAIFGVDAPGVVNLVFTYHGPSIETGVGQPRDLGDFIANTSLDNQVLDDWKSRDHLIGNPVVIDGGVASEHGDLIYVPAGGPREVPDGGSMIGLLGIALVGIETLRRKLVIA